MRLKNAHLLHAVKPPWSTNFTEFLDPRDGYEMHLYEGLIEIYHPEPGRAQVMVIPVGNVRCAEYIDPHDVVHLKAPPLDKDQMVKDTIEWAEKNGMVEPPKRRGRPPKARVD